jgi:hypothetical protein
MEVNSVNLFVCLEELESTIRLTVVKTYCTDENGCGDGEEMVVDASFSNEGYTTPRVVSERVVSNIEEKIEEDFSPEVQSFLKNTLDLEKFKRRCVINVKKDVSREECPNALLRKHGLSVEAPRTVST